VICYYLTVVVLNASAMATVFQSQLSSLFFNILKTPRFWCVILAGPWLAVLPDIYFKAYHNVFTPNPIEKIIKLRGKQLSSATAKPSNKKGGKKEETKKGQASPPRHKKIMPN